MSLLLDALRQAEKNKQDKQEQKGDTPTPDVTNTPSAEASAEDELVELDVLPDFDLSVEQQMPESQVTDESADDTIVEQRSEEESTERSLSEPDIVQEEEPVSAIAEDTDSPLNDNELPAEQAASVSPSLAKQVERSDQKPEPATAVEKQDQPVQAESQLEAQPEQSPQTDAELAHEIVFVSNNINKRHLYWVVLIIVVLVLAAGMYLYFLAKPVPATNQDVEEFIINDGMGDGLMMQESGIVVESNEESKTQDTRSEASNDSIQVMAAPEKKTYVVEAAASQQLEQQDRFSTSDDAVTAVDYPDDFQVKIKRQTSTLSRHLSKAYGAYQNEDFDQARDIYTQILKKDHNNIDALLGLASISEQFGQLKRAQVLYEKILNLDGNHIYANNALIRINSANTQTKSESHYKQLLEQYPEQAHTYASLANFYAARQRWNEAQQAYFQAVEKDAKNPDYHFNLAICLDHLGKKAVALRYYQLAVELAKIAPATFNSAQAANRIQQLQDVNQ